jgi:molybdopterin-guanine dinucleotide biosynthesis protein
VTWHPRRPPFDGRLAVVGGQCSKVGKTALVVDLIRAFPNLGWTAVKLTPHAGAGCPVNGAGCGCGPEEHAFAIRYEGDAAGSSDTSRFLAAGARRAIWVETKEGHVEEALSALASELAEADAIVIESDAIVEFWHPDLLLMVLDAGRLDFKESAREALELADAVVTRSSETRPTIRSWRELSQKPTFVQLLGQPLPLGVEGLVQQVIGKRHPI